MQFLNYLGKFYEFTNLIVELIVISKVGARLGTRGYPVNYAVFFNLKSNHKQLISFCIAMRKVLAAIGCFIFKTY